MMNAPCRSTHQQAAPDQLRDQVAMKQQRDQGDLQKMVHPDGGNGVTTDGGPAGGVTGDGGE